MAVRFLNLWGPERRHDYWGALREGLVPPEERRAVALLASMTDEARFSAYCRTGDFIAMGNVTRRIYLVRRFDRVIELGDGRPHASWCIHAPGRHHNPETDHIVMIRNLIEGEELEFRRIGNRSPFHPDFDSGIRNPIMADLMEDPWLSPAETAEDPNADLEESLGYDREIERHVRAKREDHDGNISTLRFRERLMRAAVVQHGRWILETVARGEPLPDARVGIDPPAGTRPVRLTVNGIGSSGNGAQYVQVQDCTFTNATTQLQPMMYVNNGVLGCAPPGNGM